MANNRKSTLDSWPTPYDLKLARDETIFTWTVLPMQKTMLALLEGMPQRERGRMQRITYTLVKFVFRLDNETHTREDLFSFETVEYLRSTDIMTECLQDQVVTLQQSFSDQTVAPTSRQVIAYDFHGQPLHRVTSDHAQEMARFGNIKGPADVHKLKRGWWVNGAIIQSDDVAKSDMRKWNQSSRFLCETNGGFLTAYNDSIHSSIKFMRADKHGKLTTTVIATCLPTVRHATPLCNGTVITLEENPRDYRQNAIRLRYKGILLESKRFESDTHAHLFNEKKKLPKERPVQRKNDWTNLFCTPRDVCGNPFQFFRMCDETLVRFEQKTVEETFSAAMPMLPRGVRRVIWGFFSNNEALGQAVCAEQEAIESRRANLLIRQHVLTVLIAELTTHLLAPLSTLSYDSIETVNLQTIRDTNHFLQAMLDKITTAAKQNQPINFAAFDKELNQKLFSFVSILIKNEADRKLLITSMLFGKLLSVLDNIFAPCFNKSATHFNEAFFSEFVDQCNDQYFATPQRRNHHD